MTPKEKIERIRLHPGASIQEAARVIQSQEIKFVIVCDEDNRLIGTVTDGDIRRAVVDGIDSSSCVSDIMNRTPKVTYQHDNRWEIREQMRNAIIRHLPELDKEGHVIDIFFLDAPDDISPLPNAVVLMAGGQGMRLRPLTENTPKPMLHIGGKPVLERIIEQLIGQGFNTFYISVNYLGHMIEEYFGDGSKWGVQVKYLYEDRPLGTAGAISKLERQTHPFIVMNGDILTKANLRALLELCVDDVCGVLGAREYTYKVPYGCLSVTGDKIISIEEKPTHHHFINAGLYVLSPKAQDYIPEDQFVDMPDVFHSLIDDGHENSYYHITEEWIDIGSKEDLQWARQLFTSGDNND